MNEQTDFLPAFLEAALRVGLERVDKWISARSNRLPTGLRELHKMPGAFEKHTEFVRQWASDVSFADLGQSRSLDEIFVDVRATVEVGVIDERDSLAISHARSLKQHILILGGPGAGKTTSVKRIAIDELRSGGPVCLVRLREVANAIQLHHSILHALGLSFDFDEDLTDHERLVLIRTHTSELLDEMRPLLVVDGIDEISWEDRLPVLRALQDLSLRLKHSRIIATSRTGDARVYLNKCMVLELQPLSAGQVKQFLMRWLPRADPNRIIAAIEQAPYSGAERRPLTLAHLCAIYRRTGAIPDRPQEIYSKVVRLLLEEWDEQRMIRRDSKYAGFNIHRRERFLEAIAYELTLRHAVPVFRLPTFVAAYHNLAGRFGLPVDDATGVLAELENYTGLVYAGKAGEYEFSHKSIQEYLVGSYIAKLAKLPKLSGMPDEAALTVAVSSDPTDHLVEVMAGVLPSSVAPARFLVPFLDRVLLENVQFPRKPELGAVFLILLDAMRFGPATPTSWQHSPELPPQLIRFGRLEDVAESLGMIIPNLQLKGDPEGPFEVAFPEYLYLPRRVIQRCNPWHRPIVLDAAARDFLGV